jgi:hypothetical protein
MSQKCQFRNSPAIWSDQKSSKMPSEGVLIMIARRAIFSKFARDHDSRIRKEESYAERNSVHLRS